MYAALVPEKPAVAPVLQVHWFCVATAPVVTIQLLAANVAPFSNPPSPVGLMSVVCAVILPIKKSNKIKL